MAVDVTTTPAFSSGNPKDLFTPPIFAYASTPNVTLYDVTPDGQKFLINAVQDFTPTPITVVVNWQMALKR